MAQQRHEYKEIQVSCTCGNTFTTRSTYSKSSTLKIEICGKCHPFYTGQKKVMDTDRRIDSFYGKYAKVAQKQK